jgi:ankyrin repeat protein
LIRVLVSNGGAVDVLNKHGLSPLHVAAQGDKAYPIAYLRENGVSVDAADNSGQTPLHWACYQGGEEAIYYLLAWLEDINK